MAGSRRYDDRHGPRRSRRNERPVREKKASLRERAAELGIFALRREFMEPFDLMNDNQTLIAERLGRRSGKAYEIGSGAMTLVGLNNFPDRMFKTATYRSLSSVDIIEIMASEFGIGNSPVEARPTGSVILLSKNEKSPRQRLCIELDCPTNKTDRLVIEEIIRRAGLGDKLKSFGVADPIEHMSIGHVDVRQISDREFDNPGLLLKGPGADSVPYEIPDKMVFDALHPPTLSA